MPVYFTGDVSTFKSAQNYGLLFNQVKGRNEQVFSVNYDYRKPIKESNEYVFDMDPSTTAPITCDGGEEGDDVGVWQFVQST